MVFEEVVSIEHRESKGKVSQIGSGVLIVIAGRTVLVTCRHVVSKTTGTYYFKYRDVLHKIDKTSDMFLESEINEDGMHSLIKDAKYFWNDFAFYECSFSCLDTIQFGEVKDSKAYDQLVLIAHDESGTQIVLRGWVRDNSQMAFTRHLGRHMEFVNLRNVVFDKAEEGHSGGAVIVVQTGKLIGILRGSMRYQDQICDSLHILTAKSIEEEYDRLTRKRDTPTI